MGAIHAARRLRGSRSGVLLVPVALSLAAGCGDFTDPPPEPASAPLEIVANNESSAACGLNRGEVAEGVHEIVVVTEGVDTVVLLQDGNGAVLLQQQGDTFAQPTGGEEPSGPSTVAAPQVHLVAGSYVVTCRYPDGSEGHAQLRVTP